MLHFLLLEPLNPGTLEPFNHHYIIAGKKIQMQMILVKNIQIKYIRNIRGYRRRDGILSDNT